MLQVVNNKFIKALKEASAKIFLQEMDKANTENLVASAIIPGRGSFQEEARADRV